MFAAEPDILSDEGLERLEERPMVVVAGTVGQDEHSVGMREIIDIKHGGIESTASRYCIRNLRTSEKFVQCGDRGQRGRYIVLRYHLSRQIHYKNIARIGQHRQGNGRP